MKQALAMKTAYFFVKTGLLGPALKKTFKIKKKFLKPPRFGELLNFPWDHLDEHVCIACSPRNPHGLKINFHKTQDADIACKAHLQDYMQGYPGVFHGGISSIILDEISAYAVIFKKKRIAVTTKLDVKWYKPLNSHDQDAMAQSRILSSSGKLYHIESQLFRSDGKVSAEAKGVFYTPTIKEFKKMSGLEQIPGNLDEWFYHED